PVLEPLVRGVLGPLEIAGEEQGRDADAPDEIAEADLKKREVAARRDAGNRNDRQGRGLGGDDRKHQGPPREPAVSQEVVGGVPLPAREGQPEDDDGGAVDRDDGDVEGTHQTTRGPRTRASLTTGSLRKGVRR